MLPCDQFILGALLIFFRQGNMFELFALNNDFSALVSL